MEVREVRCKSIISKSGLWDSQYSINPYRGCQNACVYCYAPHVLRENRKWGDFVDVKVNAPEILRKELSNINSGTVLLSSVTDPYQEIEKKYRITRRILENLIDSNLKVSILTKSVLVERDIELFQQMNCEVGMTITALSDDNRKIFEPGASSTMDRIGTLRRLHESGVRTYVFLGPLLPYISDTDLDRLLIELKVLGLDKLYVDRLNIKNPIHWDSFRSVLEKNYPNQIEKFKTAIYGSEYYERLKQRIKNALKNQLKIEFCY